MSWAGTRTVPNINPLYTVIVLKFSQAFPAFPPRPPILLQRPIIIIIINIFVKCHRQSYRGLRRTQVNSWNKHEEPKDKNPHFLHTRLILDLMRLLVNRWSPLTHTSHSVTTSWPAAATQTRVRVSTAMQPRSLRLMPFLPQPSLFLGLRTRSEYAGSHTLRLGYKLKQSVDCSAWHTSRLKRR